MEKTIEQAKKCIKADDGDKIKSMVASVCPRRPSRKLDSLLTEKTIVDEETGDNVLHYAVRHFAEDCVSLLVNPELAWSPIRRNKTDETPWTLARKSNYLPVIYLLAKNMIEVPKGERIQTRRSVTEFLLFPKEFLTHPLSSFEVFGVSDLGLVPGMSVELFQDAVQVNYNLSVQNYMLLFELLLANPEVNLKIEDPKLPVFNFAGLIVPIYADNKFHDPNCTIYPTCILNSITDHSLIDKDFLRPWSQLVCIWATHRLGFSHPKGDSKSPNARLIRLSDWCRVCLRRVASRKDICYFKFVDQLNLPPNITRFCAYEEFWPTVKRKLVLEDSLTRTIQPNTRYSTMHERWQSDEDSCRQQ